MLCWLMDSFFSSGHFNNSVIPIHLENVHKTLFTCSPWICEFMHINMHISLYWMISPVNCTWIWFNFFYSKCIGTIVDFYVRAMQSGFEGFIRDRYTLLPETKERMLATEVTASWRCYSVPLGCFYIKVYLWYWMMPLLSFPASYDLYFCVLFFQSI